MCGLNVVLGVGGKLFGLPLLLVIENSFPVHAVLLRFLLLVVTRASSSAFALILCNVAAPGRFIRRQTDFITSMLLFIVVAFHCCERIDPRSFARSTIAPI